MSASNYDYGAKLTSFVLLSLVLKYSSRIQILTEHEQWTMALSWNTGREQSVQILNVNGCLI